MNPFLQVISALNNADARYVIVGGFAAWLHGSPRITIDLDLVVDLEETEARKAIQSLLSIGFKSRLPVDPLLFANANERKRWINEKNMLVFTLLHPAHPGFVVDLLIESPASFDDFNARAREVTLDGHQARICSVDDLIAMKQKAGRPQDLADIQTLKRIQSTQG